MSASWFEFGQELHGRLRKQFAAAWLQRAGGRLEIPFLEGPARGFPFRASSSAVQMIESAMKTFDEETILMPSEFTPCSSSEDLTTPDVPYLDIQVSPIQISRVHSFSRSSGE